MSIMWQGGEDFWPMFWYRRDRDCPGSFNTFTLRHCHRFVAECEQIHTVAKLQIAMNEGRW